jgi:hypothetical protein
MADSIWGLLHYDALPKMFQHYGKSEVDSLLWENAAFKLKDIYNSLVIQR